VYEGRKVEEGSKEVKGKKGKGERGDRQALRRADGAGRGR
jgi:hypothetical protein